MDLLNNPEGILTLIKDIPNTKVGNDIIMIDNLDMLSTSFNMINYPVKMVGITIIFCIDGKLTYNIDTERTSIEANEVMILLPGKIVENIENTSQPKYATISLNPILLEDLSCNSNFQEMMKQAYVKPVLDFDYDDFNWLIKLYKDLKNYILCSKCIHYEMGIRGYLNIIFSFILKYKNQISQQNSRSKEIYYKFIELVQRNFQKQRSITYYSNLLCLTPKYLAEIVKKESGYLPSQIIAHIVIIEAKAKIKTNRYTIAQISESLNFANPSFFSKYFKAHTNLTPKEYQSSDIIKKPHN